MYLKCVLQWQEMLDYTYTTKLTLSYQRYIQHMHNCVKRTSCRNSILKLHFFSLAITLQTLGTLRMTYCWYKNKQTNNVENNNSSILAKYYQQYSDYDQNTRIFFLIQVSRLPLAKNNFVQNLRNDPVWTGLRIHDVEHSDSDLLRAKLSRGTQCSASNWHRFM